MTRPPFHLALRCAGPVGALCTYKSPEAAALRLRELVRLARGIRIFKRWKTSKAPSGYADILSAKGSSNLMLAVDHAAYARRAASYHQRCCIG